MKIKFEQRKVVAKSGILTIYFAGHEPGIDEPDAYDGVTSLISVAEGIHFGNLNERSTRIRHFNFVHSCCICQA